MSCLPKNSHAAARRPLGREGSAAWTRSTSKPGGKSGRSTGAGASKASVGRTQPAVPESSMHLPSLGERERAMAMGGEIGYLQQHHQPVPQGMWAAARLNPDAVAAWVRHTAVAGGARWQAVAPSWGEASAP